MRDSGIVALVTDFGSDSFYVGAMKATVLAACPNALLVDITHGIRRHAVLEASFVLAAVLDLFPPGTVFLAVVDPGVGTDRKNMIFKAGGRFVVGPDNGLISDLQAGDMVEGAVEIEEMYLSRFRFHRPRGSVFLGRDVFGPAAGALAAGVDWKGMGRKVGGFCVLPIPGVSVADGAVEGRGRYIDRFGNIVTSISIEHISAGFPGVDLERIGAYIAGRRIGRLGRNYSEVPPGELLAIIGSWDLVEIAVNQGSASRLLGCARAEDLVVRLEVGWDAGDR